MRRALLRPTKRRCPIAGTVQRRPRCLAHSTFWLIATPRSRCASCLYRLSCLATRRIRTRETSGKVEVHQTSRPLRPIPSDPCRLSRRHRKDHRLTPRRGDDEAEDQDRRHSGRWNREETPLAATLPQSAGEPGIGQRGLAFDFLTNARNDGFDSKSASIGGSSSNGSSAWIEARRWSGHSTTRP
jgi:hypothetical protein